MDRPIDLKLVSTVAIGVGFGVVAGWLLRGRFRSKTVYLKNKSRSTEDLTDDGITADSGEYKLVLVVRNDLKMGKGKAAAQCCHATLGVVEKLSRSNPELLENWKCVGQPKVVVKTEDESSLTQQGAANNACNAKWRQQTRLSIAQLATSSGLTTCIIRDAGRTQIAPGSKTVLGVGPGPTALVDRITGHLKLF